MRIAFTVILSLSFVLSFAQGLTLKSLKKSKEILGRTYLTLHYHPDGQNELQTKLHSNIFGTLVNANSDSLTLLVDVYKAEKFEDGQFEEKLEKTFIVPQEMTYLKANISSIQTAKSKKAYTIKQNLKTVGGILIGTGIITAANAPFVHGENRTTLLYSGASQIVIGTLLNILLKPKNYMLKSKTGTPEWSLD